MEKCKIIIDTNLWISLLIGKRMLEMRSLCNDNFISVFICDELKAEFMRVASSEKIKRYATKATAIQVLELMETSCSTISLQQNQTVSTTLRDINDLYLLLLADTVHADYIITGDKDLLILKKHNNTKIVTYNEFVASN